MRLHFLQHVAFEGLGHIQQWADANHVTTSQTLLFAPDPVFPVLESFDLLVILGGPMGINDQNKFPWLADEIAFIRECIDNNTPVLGICLGCAAYRRSVGRIG